MTIEELENIKRGEEIQEYIETLQNVLRSSSAKKIGLRTKGDYVCYFSDRFSNILRQLCKEELEILRQEFKEL